MLIKDILHPSISSRQMVCPGIFFKKWTRKVAKRIHMQSPQNVRKITSEIFKQVPWRAIISCSITKFTPSTRLAWLKNPQLSDALASLAVMIVCLTHSSKLEIGNFACMTILTPPVFYPVGMCCVAILVNLICLVTLICLVIPISLVTLCMILQFS